MRLLFVSNLFPPFHIGGYELVCQKTADGLRERGHHVEVLTSTHGSGVVEEDTVHRVLSCAYRPPDFFPDASATETRRNSQILAGEIARLKPEVVVLWNLHGLGMHRLYRTALDQAKHVATRLGDYQLWPNWDAGQPIHRESLAILLDPRLRCAANSRTLGQDLVGVGMKPNQVAVLHAYVQSNWDPLPQPPPPPTPLRLLWAGRIDGTKGLDVAAEGAILLARDWRIPTRLDIGGWGDEELLASCLARVATAAEAEAVDLQARYLGPVDTHQLAELFPRYHAYVASSVGHDTFPMTPVEAMAAGAPVVASRLGGLVEITGGGELGLLFEPGNAADLARQLNRLATDKGLVAKLRTRARQQAEVRFRREVAISRFEAFVGACAAGLDVASMPPSVPKMSDREVFGESTTSRLLGSARHLLSRTRV